MHEVLRATPTLPYPSLGKSRILPSAKLICQVKQIGFSKTTLLVLGKFELVVHMSQILVAWTRLQSLSCLNISVCISFCCHVLLLSNDCCCCCLLSNDCVFVSCCCCRARFAGHQNAAAANNHHEIITKTLLPLCYQLKKTTKITDTKRTSARKDALNSPLLPNILFC